MIFKPFQRLRGILRPSSEGLGEKLPLAGYGKLNLYKDYINLACNDGAAADFKRWIDQAFGTTYDALDDRAVEPTGPHRLLWPVDNRSWAAAMLWPSADAGGLRKFPFSFFATLPRRALGTASFDEDWPILNSIWLDLEQHYVHALGLNSIDEFYEHFKAAVVRHEAAATSHEEEELTLRRWIQALDPERPALYASQLTQELNKFISECKAVDADGADLAIRVPLAPGIDAGTQLALWLNIFRSHIKKGCSEFPGIILGPALEKVGATACLFWRDGRIEDARLFGEHLGHYDYIEDLCPPFGSDAPAASTAETPPMAYHSNIGSPVPKKIDYPLIYPVQPPSLVEPPEGQPAPAPEPEFDLDQDWATWVERLG